MIEMPHKENPNPRQKRTLDDEAQNEICDLIAAGFNRSLAARMARCSPRDLDKLAEASFAFGERIRRAEMQHQRALLRNILAASRTHWKASAWLLERLAQ